MHGLPLDQAMGLLQRSVPRRALWEVLDATEEVSETSRVRKEHCSVVLTGSVVEEVAEARLHDVAVRMEELIVC